MNAKMIIFVMALSLILSACAPPKGWEALSSGGGGDDGTGPAADPLASGSAQEGGPNAAIDNSGTVYPSGPASSESGFSAGSESGSGDDPLGDSPEDGVPMNWITYTDPKFGFSLNYPDLYTVLAEPQNLAEISPALVGRFRLLDSSLANSDVAELEPPKFSIEIYSNNGRLPLGSWMDANLPRGDKESIEINGTPCLKTTLQILLAPNQFIVCENNGNIYKFTPLGLHSEEILASFEFGQ
jgi:hypothetical protein